MAVDLLNEKNVLQAGLKESLLKRENNALRLIICKQYMVKVFRKYVASKRDTNNTKRTFGDVNTINDHSIPAKMCQY